VAAEALAAEATKTTAGALAPKALAALAALAAVVVVMAEERPVAPLILTPQLPLPLLLLPGMMMGPAVFFFSPAAAAREREATEEVAEAEAIEAEDCWEKHLFSRC